MRTLLITITILLGISLSQAQNYDRALGLRLGFSSGISYKQSLGSNTAWEGIADIGSAGLNATLLYETHTYPFELNQLYVFLGVGGHAGLWNDGGGFRGQGSTLVAGVDGIIGIEWAWDREPFAVSLDFKPAFNLIGNVGFWWKGFGVTGRWAF